MRKLSDIAKKIRSKNAGPFWLTIDVFCDTTEAYQNVVSFLTAERVADVLKTPKEDLKRFEIDDLLVLKISIPRPSVQGTMLDRDMHGASFSNVLAELVLD